MSRFQIALFKLQLQIHMKLVHELQTIRIHVFRNRRIKKIVLVFVSVFKASS
uniref:Uncharacterized protein n=1 Tax=Anguilla anguilla TaxID=7936 RepID=A0A0E9XE81_ANGAN